METDSGDNNEFGNAQQADGFVPIRIETNGVKFDQELIEEYANKEGDMDIICRGGEKLRCHSCVISCQSKIMRRSIARNEEAHLFAPFARMNCTKFSLTTMSKLLQIMYCSDASFEYANEMIEILLAAAYYNIPWVVSAVQKAAVNFCTRAEDSSTGANRCRDILLILQENVTFTVDRPNPTYAPFDPSLQTLTDELIARMQDYARKGVVPNEADPLRIANIVHDYLELEPQDRQVGRSDSMMKYISFYYADIALVDKNDIFHGIIRRNSVLQNLLIGIIPDMAPVNNPPAPPPPPDNPPAAAPAPSAAANAAAAARRQQQRRDVFGGWRRYGFGRNDPLNWMGDEQPPRRAPREPVRGVGEDPLVIRVQEQEQRMQERMQQENERLIQQQREIERRVEQRRVEQRRMEQRLIEQEERARRSREHIRQARDVMRRELAAAREQQQATAASQAPAKASAPTKKKSNKAECETALKSDCRHERTRATLMVAEKLARYRSQFEQKRIRYYSMFNAAANVAEMEKLRAKVQQLGKMLKEVPVEKRLNSSSARESHSTLTLQVNTLTSTIANAIRRATLLELPFQLPDADPAERALEIGNMLAPSRLTHRDGPEAKKRRVDETTQTNAATAPAKKVIKKEPGTSGTAGVAAASSSSAAPNVNEPAWIAISDSEDSDHVDNGE